MRDDSARKLLMYVIIIFTFIITPFASLFFHSFELTIGKAFGIPFLTELVTVLISVILFLWYKISSNKYRSLILAIFIGVITGFVVMYGFLLIWFLRVADKFTKMGHETQKEFIMHQDVYISLVTTIFDKAEKTNVRQDIDTRYGYLFEYPKKSISVEGKEYVYSTNIGRKPVYFIRLKNGKLQKLFQSGDIKNETIDTDGERKVRDMLLGKIQPIQYPQHTCCGMDDVSWSKGVPFFRIFVPERQYLKDFYSELETILLIKDKNGNILGAMVDLHGD